MNKKITIPQPADSQTVRTLLTALAERYRFLELQPIGRSVLGQEIYGVMLGGGRERVLYAAAFDGREWPTAMVLLRLCEDICEALGHDGQLADMDFRRAIAGRCLVFVPQVNPDGADFVLHGSAAEDGLDLNRCFAGTGDSAPEARALTALCRRGEFRHAVALHTHGEAIEWQHGERTPPIARMMADILAASSGYALTNAPDGETCGGFKDWFIRETGRPAFAVKMGRTVPPLPAENFEYMYAKVQEMLLLAALM